MITRKAASIEAGFTLVEIMVVTVVIGLLSAIAIPAYQKVRTATIEKQVINDGRLIGKTAQQYMMEYGVTEITFQISANGRVEGQLREWMSEMSKGVTAEGLQTIDMNQMGATAFMLTHPQIGSAIAFDAEGVRILP